MSQWTHAIGTIQYSYRKPEELEKILGKPILWKDGLQFKYRSPEWEDFHQNVWCKAFDDNEKGCGIPMGSEGSLEWYFVDTSEANENVLGEGSLIAIEGDLRDYGGETEVNHIIKWFTNALVELGAREGILKIRDDWSSETIIVMGNGFSEPIVHKIKHAEE